MLDEKRPELLEFPKDLTSLEAATKVLFFFFFFVIAFILWKYPISVLLINALLNVLMYKQIQLKYLAEEMQAISKGLEKVAQELIASENDVEVSEKFGKVRSYISTTVVHMHGLDFSGLCLLEIPIWNWSLQAYNHFLTLPFICLKLIPWQIDICEVEFMLDLASDRQDVSFIDGENLM